MMECVRREDVALHFEALRMTILARDGGRTLQAGRQPDQRVASVVEHEKVLRYF